MRVCGGGGGKLEFRLILASNWGHDTGRGSSQHLRTLERVPVNKKLLIGTVPVNNLFHFGILLIRVMQIQEYLVQLFLYHHLENYIQYFSNHSENVQVGY